MAKWLLKGRGVVPGIAEGEALVCPKSITGWGGIDPATGIIKEYGHIHKGKSIKGKILVLPGSKGSNGWSCYFGAAGAAGTGPKGWLISRIDSATGVASAVMKIPTVVDFDEPDNPLEHIQTGDIVRVDGSAGHVEIIKKAS